MRRLILATAAAVLLAIGSVGGTTAFSLDDPVCRARFIAKVIYGIHAATTGMQASSDGREIANDQLDCPIPIR